MAVMMIISESDVHWSSSHTEVRPQGSSKRPHGYATGAEGDCLSSPLRRSSLSQLRLLE